MAPINGGQKAPPATAITKNDDPFFVKAPKSRIPKAKIVGNIIDMKKYVENNATTEIIPKPSTTKTINMTFIKLYTMSILLGFINFRKKDPEILPSQKRPMPPKARISDAACSEFFGINTTPKPPKLCIIF